MPIQYLQTPSHLSQQDSHGHESFTNAYSFPPYPLTPYPTVPEIENRSPFPFETLDNPIQTTEHEAERRARTPFNAPSTSGLCHSSPTPSLNISSTELQRVLDSLLDQVDWLEVAAKVARNRAPSIYYNTIEKILLAHIYQLVKIEGEDDDAAQFKNGNEDDNYVYEGDDEEEGEDGSGPTRESEDEDGDRDEGGDDDGDMDDDEDEDDDEEEDDEDENDEMNDDEYDEDSVSEYNE